MDETEREGLNRAEEREWRKERRERIQDKGKNGMEEGMDIEIEGSEGKAE